MAWQNVFDPRVPWDTVGATELQASTTLSASAASTGVFVGKGRFDVKIDVTAINLGTGFDTVNFLIQANTLADTSTYVEIGQLVLGDATGIGLAQGVDSYVVPVNNCQDNQIRIYTYLNGSAVDVTFAASITPLRDKMS